MALSLLVPLALLGMLFVVVPLLLHLIDKRRVQKIDFPAIHFLLSAQQKLRRRRRVRDPYLLLMRILALLALAFSYATPVVSYEKQAPAGADLGGNVVFLLDNSLSMSYRVGDNTLLALAKERIQGVLERMGGTGRAGLIVFNRTADDKIGGVTPELPTVLQALSRVEPTFEATDLRPALLAGLRAVLSSPEGSGDLYLLSDMAAHSLGSETALELPERLKGRVRLIIASLDAEEPSNRTLTGMTRAGGEGGHVELTAHVRGIGSDVGTEVPLDLRIKDEAVARGYVTVGADETVDKVFELPSHADPSGPGVLELGSDRLEADNAYYFTLSSRRELNVVIIDGDPGNNIASAESYFLERALNPRRSSGSRISAQVVGEGSVGRLDPKETAVVFLLNVSDPSTLADRLQTYVENGGGLFIALGDRVRYERYNRSLSGVLPASLGEVKAASPDLTGERPPSLGYPQTSHPLFQAFREAGATVFGSVATFRFFPTAPTLKKGGAVLLQYSNGLPALLERRVGNGRVMMFTSSLDRDWNTFPLKSVFLPFAQEATHYLAGNQDSEGQERRLVVGQPMVLEGAGVEGTLLVVDPEGKVTPLEGLESSQPEPRAAVRRVFRQTSRPGHYRVMIQPEGGGEPYLSQTFSVNVSPKEADLERFTVEQVKTRLPHLPVLLEGQADAEERVVVERRVNLARGLLWALLAFLALEGVLAWRRQGADARMRHDQS